MPPSPRPPTTTHRRLLTVNPDNYRVHDGLRGALGLAPGPDGSYTPAQRAELAALYAELAGEFPRSAAVQRIPLDFTVRSLLWKGGLGALKCAGCAGGVGSALRVCRRRRRGRSRATARVCVNTPATRRAACAGGRGVCRRGRHLLPALHRARHPLAVQRAAAAVRVRALNSA